MGGGGGRGGGLMYNGKIRVACRIVACTSGEKLGKPPMYQILKVWRIVKTHDVCNIHNISGLCISATDKSAQHKHQCTLIQNGPEYCKLHIKRPQTVMFSNCVW